MTTDTGESTDDKHTDWIEILDYNTGVSQTASASASSGGGVSAERADFQDFVITKALDKASPKLSVFCADGSHIPEITLELCRAGGDKMKYMEYKMTNVMITSVSCGGSSSAETLPTEQVTFNFGKMQWTYTHQKRADGSGGGNVAAGWDLEKNSKV